MLERKEEQFKSEYPGAEVPVGQTWFERAVAKAARVEVQEGASYTSGHRFFVPLPKGDEAVSTFIGGLMTVWDGRWFEKGVGAKWLSVCVGPHNEAVVLETERHGLFLLKLEEKQTILYRGDSLLEAVTRANSQASKYLKAGFKAPEGPYISITGARSSFQSEMKRRGGDAGITDLEAPEAGLAAV